MQPNRQAADRVFRPVPRILRRKHACAQQQRTDIFRRGGRYHAQGAFAANPGLQRIAQHAQIPAVVKVQVREHQSVQRLQRAEFEKPCQYAAAAVKEHPGLPVLDEIPGAGAALPRKRAASPQRCQLHLSVPAASLRPAPF